MWGAANIPMGGAAFVRGDVDAARDCDDVGYDEDSDFTGVLQLVVQFI